MRAARTLFPVSSHLSSQWTDRGLPSHNGCITAADYYPARPHGGLSNAYICPYTDDWHLTKAAHTKRAGRGFHPCRRSRAGPALARQLSHLGEWSTIHSTEPHQSHRLAIRSRPSKAPLKPYSLSRPTRARRLTHVTYSSMYELRQ